MQCDKYTAQQCIKMIRSFEETPHQFTDLKKLELKLIECKACIDTKKTPVAERAFNCVQDLHAFAFIDSAIIAASLNNPLCSGIASATII